MLLILGIIAAIVQIPKSSNVPKFATVSAIEHQYRPQVDRLVELAYDDSELSTGGVEVYSELKALFDDPAILKVALQLSPNGYRGFAKKDYQYYSRTSFLEADPISNAAVVNRYWDTTSTGKKLNVLSYHRRLINSAGNEVGAIIEFDYDMLEMVAQAK